MWRKRAIATAGVAAVVASGSVALASSAYAAGTTLTLTAPTSVANNFVAAPTPFSIEVNNTGAGNAALNAATGSLTVTVPAGVNCGFVQFTPTGITASSDGKNGNASPALTTANPFQTGSCLYTGAFTQGATTDETYNYTLQVQSAPITGNLTATFALAGATSNTTTTAITAPATAAATTFSSTPPPAAIIYKNYNFNEIKTVATGAVFTVFGGQANPSVTPAGTYSGGPDVNGNGGAVGAQPALPPTTSRTLASTATANGLPAGTFETVPNSKTGLNDAAIDLSDREGTDTFLLDTVTGNIVSQGPTQTNSKPFYQFTVITNVGAAGGGATTPSNGIGGGSKVAPTPPVAVGDIDSAPFQLPVLFSDVSAGGTFSDAIYKLANAGTISGFADGSFRPTAIVSRQAFAHFLFAGKDSAVNAGGLNDGPCNASTAPSQFPDVPNGSQFCTSINALSTFNVVNGYSDGKFHPSSAISRQAIAAFLFRYVNLTTTTVSGADAKCTSPTGFSDVSTSNPFCGDIEFLVANKIANGYADGTFHPAAGASRQAVAQFIFNAATANNSAQVRRNAAK